MVKPLFDTNLLIDFLNGVPQAREEIARYAERSISIVTWMEVMVGADRAVEEQTRDYLRTYTVVPLDDQIASRAVALRKENGIRLPDAIIWASADVHALLLVTRNTKDFGTDRPGIRVPYKL